MRRNEKPRPGHTGRGQSQHQVGGVDDAMVRDLDDLVRRVEVEAAIEAFMYELGRERGRAEGRAEAQDYIERIRLDREEVSRLRPTGATCRCGRAEYRRSA